MTPARGTVLVRKLQTEDTIRGGKIVLPEQVRESMTPNQVEIVATGLPVLCDDEDCERLHGVWVDFHDYRSLRVHDHELSEGQWVIIAPRSLVETHEDGLYLASQDAVLAIVSVDPPPSARRP